MIQTKKHRYAWDALAVLLLIAAVALSEYYFFQLWRLDWQVPMLYGGDGIYWVGQVQRSYGDLTPQLGWPFYQAPSPYEPNYDLIYDAFVAFVGLFTKNTGVVFNLYVLVIPFANALAGYAAFRLFKLRRWLAWALGLTFGLCPYVQQRLAGHMMLAAVEFVPFSLLLLFWCVEQESTAGISFNRPGQGFFKNWRNWLSLALCWGIANNGAAYYPYFTCFLLCVAALCLWLRHRRAAAMVPCFVTIGEIVAFMVPDFFPMVVGAIKGVGSTITNGTYRSPIGSDIYGLRISSLLLSPNGYGWGKLGKWINYYLHLLGTDEGPMYNENGFGYLGIIGIVGFLLLLVWLFQNHNWQGGKALSGQSAATALLHDRLWLLARLNVAALLLATITGFGAIIGIFLRFIRGYNRISPYLAFMALLAVGLCAEYFLAKWPIKRRRVAAALLAVALAYGYWEQQGLYTPDYEGVQTTWYQDAAFMEQVEAAAGDGAVLFQLPYMKAFENGSQENMWDYTLLRGPLHSDTLKFSYGGAYGSENDEWYKATAELEPEACVAELKAQNITGIYLDLDGYPADDREATLAAYTAAAGCAEEDVIISEGGTLCYIPLAD